MKSAIALSTLVFAFTSSAQAGSLGGGGVLTAPTFPGPITGLPCDPAKDPNCGGLGTTSPADGHIVPDPTRSIDQCERGWPSVATCQAAPDFIGLVNGAGYFQIAMLTDHDEKLVYYSTLMLNPNVAGDQTFDVSATDLDGDGVLDLAVGIPGDSTFARDAGAVYIWYDAADRTLDARRPDTVIYGTIRGGHVGWNMGRVAGGGKGDPDGLLINSPYEGYNYYVQGDRLPGKLTREDLVRE